MATHHLLLLTFITITTLTTPSLAKPNEQQQELNFLQSSTPVHTPLTLKLSHFKLYWHDVFSGRNPTAVPIAKALTNITAATKLGFGSVVMIDDALTVGPEPTSKLVGRAQGLYAQSSTTDVAAFMAMNFAFVEGKYNGSTIAIVGRNPVLDEVRELAVVGGSGMFRFARGYAQLRTHSLDWKTGDAVVEYNVFVEHY